MAFEVPRLSPFTSDSLLPLIHLRKSSRKPTSSGGKRSFTFCLKTLHLYILDTIVRPYHIREGPLRFWQLAARFASGVLDGQFLLAILSAGYSQTREPLPLQLAVNFLRNSKLDFLFCCLLWSYQAAIKNITTTSLYC